MNKENNIIKHDWGYELIWCKDEDMAAKILVFSNANTKTPFIMHSKIKKSFFINNGKCNIRWIDTTTGKIFQKELVEGNTFDVKCLVPYSITSLTASLSISETSNGDDQNDKHVIIGTEFFQ